MVSAIASDPLARAALWAAAAALIAAFGFFCGVVVFRLRLLRRLDLDRRTTALWNPLLAQCAEQVPESLPPLEARDARRFLLLWCRAQESLRGEAQERLREMARRLGAEAHARRLLGSRNLSWRLLAVVSLGHMRARDLAPMLYTQIASAPPLASLAAAKALVRIDAALGLQQVLAAVAARDDWPVASAANILRECDPQIVGPALSSAIRNGLAKDRSGTGLARLLRLHGAAQQEALRDVVLQALSSAAGAEALAAALGALWHPQDVTHARRLLEHPEWFVRVAAARAIGRLGGADDVPRLTARLADASWWVRYRAAQALCSLPSMDGPALEALAARLTDRFAGDMLRQAMAEKAAS